ncbi:TylF/MycF family methyltransferase [Vicingaceae bacterium]|nr:TylF/MycF family methyltransferase [Vicingaceae bacterium]
MAINCESSLILKAICPPQKIESITQMKRIIDDKSRLTLIEKPFFDEINPIIKEISTNNVEGDIVFVGVYRGGGALYLKSLFEEYGFSRTCWLFDSFDGFKNQLLSENETTTLENFTSQGKFKFQPSSENVRSLFKKYSCDTNLKIVEGFIEDSLQSINFSKIAFLHIDIDTFSSTTYALEQLYSKISKGGWIVIDDYHVNLYQCQEAVEKFRKTNEINNKMVTIGRYPCGWQV